MKRKLTLAFFGLLCYSGIINAQTVHERLIWGTGEYSPQSNWHGILQFDRADTMNSSVGNIQYTPSSTIPIRQCSDNGVALNFGHGFYYRESSDELYVSTLFDNSTNILTTNPDTAVGSIAIFDNISTLNGAQTITRRLFGNLTQLKQPHSCWVDETRDILYVANTFGDNILVFDSASIIDGNRAPDRIIPILGRPVYVFVDAAVDRLFVTVMPNGMPSVNPKIEVFKNASTANSSVSPNVRIEGSNTRLNIGNMTIHNAWFRSDKQLLAVGHHTSELLFYNMSSVNWNASPTQNYNLTPRVILVEDTSLYGQNDINLYGIFWDVQTDRMFCSVGIDNPNGGPMPGTPPTAIKVYSNVSDSTVSGFVSPSKTYMWSNGNTYYPPQPLWLKKTNVSGTPSLSNNTTLRIYPQPAQERLIVDLGKIPEQTLHYRVHSIVEQLIVEGNTDSQVFDIDVQNWPAGVYILQVYNKTGQTLRKFIVSGR